MDQGRGGTSSASGVLSAWAADADAAAGLVASLGSVWEVSDADLLAVLRSEQVAAARRDAARLAVILELDTRGIARAGGAASTGAWLAGRLLVDPRQAHADVAAAHRLDPHGDVPLPPGAGPSAGRVPGEVAVAAAGRALAAGDISRAHADAVARLVGDLPTTSDPGETQELRAKAEQLLLEQCAVLPPVDVRKLAQHLRHLVDPDGVLSDERTAERTATFWTHSDPDRALVRFGGQTDAVTGAQLQTLIDAHCAPRPDVDPVTGKRGPDLRSARQRRGEAFAHLVRLAAGADDSLAGGAATTLVVTTSLDTLRASLGERGMRCAQTETGQPISAALTRRLACDATIVPVLLGSASEPLDVGRATRTIPPAIRRALAVRDRGCAFPGCDRPHRWADAHHIRHWADAGPTSMDNLVLLCGYHHDVIHHSNWTVRITNGRPVFTPPASSGSRRPPRPPPATSGRQAAPLRG